MKGIVHIHFNGKKERLQFNRFAFDELKTYLFKDKPSTMLVTEGELMKSVIHRWRENESLLLKQLVYAGIAGDSYITDDEPRLTKEEIGQFIAHAKYEELLEVWKVFIEASGIDLTPDKDAQAEPEEQTEDEKKKVMKTS